MRVARYKHPSTNRLNCELFFTRAEIQMLKNPHVVYVYLSKENMLVVSPQPVTAHHQIGRVRPYATKHYPARCRIVGALFPGEEPFGVEEVKATNCNGTLFAEAPKRDIPILPRTKHSNRTLGQPGSGKTYSKKGQSTNNVLTAADLSNARFGALITEINARLRSNPQIEVEVTKERLLRALVIYE